MTKVVPWKSIVSLPQDHWFCDARDTERYWFRIGAIRLPQSDAPLQVQFTYGDSWWNVEDLLGKFKHASSEMKYEEKLQTTW